MRRMGVVWNRRGRDGVMRVIQEKGMRSKGGRAGGRRKEGGD
jgi:hypothetical protein